MVSIDLSEELVRRLKSIPGSEDHTLDQIIDSLARQSSTDATVKWSFRPPTWYELASDAILITEPETYQIVYYNKMFENLLGPRERKNQTLYLHDIFNSESMHSLSNTLEECIKLGGAYAEELHITRSRGEFHVVNMVANILAVEPDQHFIQMILQDITNRKMVEDALYFIAHNRWKDSNPSYLEAVVTYLGEKLNVAYAFVDEIVAHEPDEVRTYALYAHGKIAEAIEYSLVGTPCENVIGGKLCVYPDSVQEKFPKDILLQKMEAVSYAGIPLWSSDGQALGLLSVIGQKPIYDTGRVHALLQVFAMSVAYELERIKSEKARRELENQAQSTLDSLAAHIAIVGEDGVILAVNQPWQTFAEQNGAKTNVGAGANYFAICEQANGKDAEFTRELLGGMKAVLRGELPHFEVEYPCHAPDEKRWFMAHVTPIPNDPKPTRIVVAHENITERKQAEQKIAENARYAGKIESEIILHNVADPIVFTDLDGSIRYVNPAWERLYGYTLKEVVGLNPRILKSHKTPPETHMELWQTLRNGETWSGLLYNKSKSGIIYDVIATIAPVKDAESTLQYFVAVYHDVTEEHKLATMRSEFIANAAHDLANPVAVLNTSLHILRKHPEQLERRIGIIDQQVNRLDRLINDLLTISRLERRMFLQAQEPIQLEDLIRNIIEAQNSLAMQKGIILSFLPSSEGGIIEADYGQIERVVVNLISNAINYTPGEGAISVTVLKEADRCVLSVKDSGIGIAPEDLPHIFDPFYRADNAQQAGFGTGLGLAIVKEIVELHRAEIYVSSEVGVGTEFQIHFPLMTEQIYRFV